MGARVRSAALLGVQGRVVEVTAEASPGLPGLEQLGLPGPLGDRAERAWSAITYSGLAWPMSRVTVMASPLAMPKHPVAVDLAVAVAVLAADGQVPAAAAGKVTCYAGLGLGGQLLPVPGVLPATAAAAAAGCRAAVVAAENAAEAALVPGITVIGARTLGEVTGWLHGGPAPRPPRVTAALLPPLPTGDMADVRGNPVARRAAEVSAAGGHHLCLAGPTGSGKRLLASRLAGLLPPLEAERALEVTAAHSAAGLLGSHRALVTAPRSWAPSRRLAAADVTGGRTPLCEPGVAALAHGGVLVLEEAPSFSREVLRALRKAAGSGWIAVSQGASAVRFPARFILAATASPCWRADPAGPPGPCSCPGGHAPCRDLLSLLLGDRASLRVTMTPPGPGETGPGEASAVIAARVAWARDRAAARLAGAPWQANAEIPGSQAPRRFPPAPAGRDLIDQAIASGQLTTAAAADVLRVAWTVADLAGHGRPGRDDCATALAYRTGGIQ